MPVDFDSLTEAGSMMARAAMIVGTTRPAWSTRALLRHVLTRSRAQVHALPGRTACSLDHSHAHHGGKGQEADLAVLTRWPVMQDVCSARSAPRRRHTVARRCATFRNDTRRTSATRSAAGVCKALIEYSIDPGKCDGCPRVRARLPDARLDGPGQAAAHARPAPRIKCGLFEASTRDRDSCAAARSSRDGGTEFGGRSGASQEMEAARSRFT